MSQVETNSPPTEPSVGSPNGVAPSAVALPGRFGQAREWLPVGFFFALGVALLLLGATLVWRLGAATLDVISPFVVATVLALRAAREGRLRDRLATLQKQAQNAATPEARSQSATQARELATQLAGQGKTKGIALLKSGAARGSAFVLLGWALLGCPLVAALTSRNARR